MLVHQTVTRYLRKHLCCCYTPAWEEFWSPFERCPCRLCTWTLWWSLSACPPPHSLSSPLQTFSADCHSISPAGQKHQEGHDLVKALCIILWECVCVCALTSSGALQMDLGSLKFTTDVKAWEKDIKWTHSVWWWNTLTHLATYTLNTFITVVLQLQSKPGKSDCYEYVV